MSTNLSGAADEGPSSASTPPHSSKFTESITEPQFSTSNSPAPAEASPENPFAKLTMKQASNIGASSIHISPAESHPKRAREDSDTIALTPPPRKSPVTPREETLEAFESRILSNIFR